MKSKVLKVEFQFFEKTVLGRDGFGQNWIQDMNSMTIPDIKMRFLPMLEILRVIFFPSTLCGIILTTLAQFRMCTSRID